MLAYLWAAMMLVWLAAWFLGLWWVWPHFARGLFTAELVTAIFWLVTGGVGWTVALRFGLARFWGR